MQRRLAAAATLALIGCLVVAPATAATAAPVFLAEDFPANPIERPGYQLVSHDEFNGTDIDTDLWGDAYLPHWAPPGRSVPNYSVDDGYLNLTLLPEQPGWEPRKDGNTVVSSIQSMNKNWIHNFASYTDLAQSVPTEYGQAQRYGYFEIRAKVQKGSGHHSAFWMVGTQPDQGTSNGVTQMNAEIDIFEILGANTNQIQFTMHPVGDPKLTKQHATIDTGVDLSANYHVYGIEWTPGSLKLFLDNQLVATAPMAPDYPMLTFLGLYENRQGGWTGAFDSSIPYPKNFSIDYYRAYQVTPTLPLTVQADTADVYGATRVIRTAGADEGLALTSLGGSPDSVAEFRNVYVPTTGTYALDVRYRSGQNRDLTIEVNGGAPFVMPALNSGSAQQWATATENISLDAGFNRIRVSNAAAAAPDLDFITVREVGPLRR